MDRLRRPWDAAYPRLSGVVLELPCLAPVGDAMNRTLWGESHAASARHGAEFIPPRHIDCSESSKCSRSRFKVIRCGWRSLYLIAAHNQRLKEVNGETRLPLALVIAEASTVSTSMGKGIS